MTLGAFGGLVVAIAAFNPVLDFRHSALRTLLYHPST